MVGKLAIGAIACAVLFIIGILTLTFVNPFSEEWLIGIGFIGGAIGLVALIIYLKARS